MGLLDKLTTQGSKFTYPADGTTATPYPQTYNPPINPLATQQSKLHGDLAGAVNGGYSLNGGPVYQSVNANWHQYKDGDANNALPLPSNLDLNGTIPPFQTSPVQIGQAGPQALPYIFNQPN
jgi:hypothetical protein